MATNQESIFPELEDFDVKGGSSTLTSEDFIITSDASKSIFPEESLLLLKKELKILFAKKFLNCSCVNNILELLSRLVYLIKLVFSKKL